MTRTPDAAIDSEGYPVRLTKLDGFIVGAKVVPRVADHEREKDERLDDYEERWVEYVARRLEREEEVVWND